MKNLWFSWSTGKDSAFALSETMKRPDIKVTGLFTSINETFHRVAMHAVRESLLQAQADALGLPLHLVRIPQRCSNEIYEVQMRQLIAKAKENDVQVMGFGDLFLQEVRDYREKMMKDTGIECLFPLWNQPTDQLALQMIDSGMKAVLTCIDPKKLPASFAGRDFDQSLLRDLPAGIDPCGENGEFHTFVYESPIFQKPLAIKRGEQVERDGFVFQDVQLAL